MFEIKLLTKSCLDFIYILLIFNVACNISISCFWRNELRSNVRNKWLLDRSFIKLHRFCAFIAGEKEKQTLWSHSHSLIVQRTRTLVDDQSNRAFFLSLNIQIVFILHISIVTHSLSINKSEKTTRNQEWLK